MKKDIVSKVKTNREFSTGQTIVYNQRVKQNFTRFSHYTVSLISESNHLIVRNDVGVHEMVNPNCFCSLPVDRKRKIKNINSWIKAGII